MLLRSVPPSCRACCHQRDVKVLSEIRVIMQKTTRLCVPPPRADRETIYDSPVLARRIFLPRARQRTNARRWRGSAARNHTAAYHHPTLPTPRRKSPTGRELSQTRPCVTALRASLPAIYIPVELKARPPRPMQECTTGVRGPLGNEDHVSRIEAGRCQPCI
jgi:hypothetical protein